MSAEEIERGRLDPAWRRVVTIDSVAEPRSSPNPETWEDITPQALNAAPMHLPLHGDVAGPSVARVQLLLDRARFSPGIIDGRWGKNTEKAVYWLQRREGLSATGRVDQATFHRLVQLAGSPAAIARTYRLTAADVSGPFIEIPDSIYEKAELDCLCYESLSEKLGELFHTSPEMLSRLNPDVDLNNLSAGDQISVPAVEPTTALNRLANAGRADVEQLEGVAAGTASPSESIAKIVVSDGGHFVHALDASGRILFHFPSTLGADYSPSPTGDYRVNAVAFDPWWHYQPDILQGVPDSRPDAQIPPGPNNAVGVVWMDLSKPHYGIHGTSAPETIGYATSNGCVRLTNWDAVFLAQRVADGIPVEFRDPVAGRGE